MDEKTRNSQTVSSHKDSLEHLKFAMGFGWGRFRPKCLQFLDNAYWFLGFIVAFTTFQAIVIIGLTSITLPTVEKRFSLTGKEMGVIAAANDISALVIVIFISFYGDYGNKIRWIAGGGVLVGFGSLLYALPQLIIGIYEPSPFGPKGSLCIPIPGGAPPCNLESDSRWYYMAVLFIGQFIMGAGISPFYALVPAYLDENVHPKLMPVFLGVWHCALYIAPGLGMIMGGEMLGVYIDIEQPDDMKLVPPDPRYIGAWWLGFLVFGILTFLVSLIILGFPRELSGAKEIRQEHIEKGNIKKPNDTTKPSLRKLLPELKTLLLNWTFTFNSLGITATSLFVGAVSPFLAKLLILKFKVQPQKTGYAVAATFIPSMTIGIVIGSFTVKRFSLKDACKKSALMIVVLTLLGFFLPPCFMVPGCKNIELAGLDFQSSSKISNSSVSFKDTCNTGCPCSQSRFAPVCGSDGRTYFDACHAGCSSSFPPFPPDQTFFNCTCVRSSNSSRHPLGMAKSGECDRDCKNLIFFGVVIGFTLLTQFAKMVPEKTVLLRCVPDNKRAFATGVQYIINKALGLLPGPIIFGDLVDTSCKLWQDTCGERGRCFIYDVDKLSMTTFIFGMCLAALSFFFFFLSWFLCKSSDEDHIQVELNVKPPAEKYTNGAYVSSYDVNPQVDTADHTICEEPRPADDMQQGSMVNTAYSHT